MVCDVADSPKIYSRESENSNYFNNSYIIFLVIIHESRERSAGLGVSQDWALLILH